MININQIVKAYHGQVVLNIPALHIPRGESVGLVGNNGAGKTTLFSLLLDLIVPDSGEIKIDGQVVFSNDSWKKITTSFLDESFLISYLTAEEYFYFIGKLREVNESEVDRLLEMYKDFFNDEVLGKKKYLRDLSKGNQKKVGIISTLIGDPQLIILDEPFANLDPSTQFRLKSIIKELASTREKTIVVSSHDLSHTVDISDRILVLQKGVLIQDIQTSAETLVELEAFFNQLDA
ncbi:ABC transporter ATP-binding protein [Sphingobacterium sp. HJSM2_6]|uniref:ABC transporter ATP-binding protein n=1 Tax=Sphingobacterium sp. HJSM2_6 TaxID=3366264 RepID=UPI003BEDC1E0